MCRARHERGRPRTRERALLTLQRLADALAFDSPPPHHRLRLAFAVAHPLGVTLRKELGEGLIAMGLIGEKPPQPSQTTSIVVHHMESVDAWRTSSPPHHRLQLAFAVAHPLGVTLRKELGKGLIAMGLVGVYLICTVVNQQMALIYLYVPALCEKLGGGP